MGKKDKVEKIRIPEIKTRKAVQIPIEVWKSIEAYIGIKPYKEVVDLIELLKTHVSVVEISRGDEREK